MKTLVILVLSVFLPFLLIGQTEYNFASYKIVKLNKKKYSYQGKEYKFSELMPIFEDCVPCEKPLRDYKRNNTLQKTSIVSTILLGITSMVLLIPATLEADEMGDNSLLNLWTGITIGAIGSFAAIFVYRKKKHKAKNHLRDVFNDVKIYGISPNVREFKLQFSGAGLGLVYTF